MPTADETIHADETIQLRGTCVTPVIRTQLTLDFLRPGQVLCVVGRGVATQKDLEVWARATGTQTVGVEQETDGSFCLYLRKP